MQPTDLQHVVVPADPQMHPDGVRVAYVLTEIDIEEDRYHRTIHLWDGSRNVRFTHGPSDTTPRWSPDGRMLAFLRKGEAQDARAQLYVMPTGGGEAQVRTNLPLGVTEVAWSPDSTRLVVVGDQWVDHLADLDDDERRRVPKRITKLPFRTDSEGQVHERQRHLWLVTAVGDDEPRCLTSGAGEQGAPVWHPNGTAIAYLDEPVGGSDTEPHEQPMELDLATGQCRPVADPGMWVSVDYHPDGRLFLTGSPEPYDWPAPLGIWTVSVGEDGRERLSPSTAFLDRDVNPGSPSCLTVGPRFVDGGWLTALEGRGVTGVVHVGAVGAVGSVDEPPEVTELIGGRRCVTGYSARADGSAVAFTATDPATPGELYWREGGKERCLTDLTRRFRSKVDVRPTLRFSFDRDGEQIDVWIVIPDGFDTAEDGTIPILFNIHGGPTAQYGEYFFDEFQVQASAGYLVVAANPRGSSGRGADFARAVVGAWIVESSVDTLDLEAVVDAALQRYPQADRTRVGIMGGSYGGYATARLLARTGRYGSAIVERGLLNWESFAGTSDIGSFFDRMFLGASLTEGRDVHHRASPLGTAHRITTPTLILHSESDHRCPIEQGEQLFVALRHAGVPTEMVRFPEEGHELSRSGSPKHRVERAQIVLEWHARHLR